MTFSINYIGIATISITAISSLIYISKNIFKNKYTTSIVKNNDFVSAIKIITSKDEKSKKNLFRNIILYHNVNMYNELKKICDYNFIDNELFEFACNYPEQAIILDLLNNKYKPTNNSFLNLFKNSPTSTNLSYIIQYFYNFGYKFAYDDILYALEHKFIIPKEFVKIKIIPTEKFYKLCDKDFFPDYEYENLYNINWIMMMLYKSKHLKCKDVKFIHDIIIKHKIKTNDEILNKIINEIPQSKTKENLLNYLLQVK